MKKLQIIILAIAFAMASQLCGASVDAAAVDSHLSAARTRLAFAKKRFDEASACYTLLKESLVVNVDSAYIDVFLAIRHEFVAATLELGKAHAALDSAQANYDAHVSEHELEAAPVAAGWLATIRSALLG